jgi:hypothetical protein
MRNLCFLLAVATSAGACGSGTVGDNGGVDGGGSVDLTGLQSIDLTPMTLTLTIDGDTPASQTYSALGHFADGHTADITSKVGFSLTNNELGAFSHNQLTTFSRNGGKATITGTAGEISGLADLTVVIKERYTDPQATGLPADPGSAFGGTAGSANKPDMVYPPDGVLLPPNLGKIEVQFMPGTGNNFFEISFEGVTTDVKVYTSCTNPLNGGCIYTPEAKVWTWLAESNRGGAVTVTIRGTSAVGAAVGSSASQAMTWSADDLAGGMYYWTTPKNQPNDQAARIYRWDFGSTTQTEPEEVVTPADTGDHCVGCHAVSPDGARLFVTSEGSYDAFTLLRNLKTGQDEVPWNTSDPVAFASWEWPDGARFVGTFADQGQTGFRSFDLNLYRGSDGGFLESIPVGGSNDHRTAHPDWSPDGSMISFTRLGGNTDGDNDAGTSVRGYRSQIRLVTKMGDGWTAPVDLSASSEGKNAYYPAFSPLDENKLPYADSALVLFNRSSCDDGHDAVTCDMYDDPNASLWIMKPQAGATAVELVKANAPGKTDTRTVVENSFAKWTPFTFKRTGELGQRLFWMTFSSDRNMGLRHPADGAVLIWMSGLDPDDALSGFDGSFPAFCLPFQDFTRDNHTAQWTKKVVVIP